MAGFIDIVGGIPPLLVNGLSITNPSNQTITTARLLGDDNATYGAIGWVPPTDGSRFITLETGSVKDTDTLEAFRVWAEYDLAVFVGIEHSDTQTATGRFQLETIAWTEALRQFVASNRRLNTIASSLFPQAGDIRWTFKGGKVQEHHLVLGIPYYGMLCPTTVSIDIAVNYQF